MILLALLGAAPALAQGAPEPAPQPEPAAEPAPEPQPELARRDDEFGPLLLIERIDIVGNTATQEHVIRRVLRIQPGDVLRASDRRMREARFKVLALGYFRDVTLAMNKGSARGHVILEVHVAERGTIVLNRLWFGRSALTPYWVGADVGERNLLGLGVALGAGFIYAAESDVIGARSQWATELRAEEPSLFDTRWGANAAFTLVRGSEAYRVAGTGDPDTHEQRAFPYRRLGARFGITRDVTSLTRLAGTLRLESIHTALPVAPTQQLPDGRDVGIDLHLLPGTSRVATAGFAFDRDTRPDPILPHSGHHLLLSAEVGLGMFGDYRFATVFGRFDHYWPTFGGRHALGIRLAGGVVLGDAPRFDRIHVADVNRMLTPRALGLVLSTAPPFDILGTRRDKPSYGEVGGTVNLEYAIQVFRGRGRKRVYGGDMFFGAGLWGLAEHEDLRARATSVLRALPIDLYVDAGLRIDTDVGVFELTIANALGRLR